MSDASANHKRPTRDLTANEPVTVLDALRSTTSRQHRELEALPLNARLLAPDFTLDEYRETLARMYGFYDPLAAHADMNGARWAPHAADRARALAADLGDLGYDAADRAAIPRCSDLPALDTADRSLGCAYVFEGAALGGRVIRRHVARLFEHHDGVPFRFLNGDGERTGEHWKAFCAELCATARDVDEVCAAAAAAFDAMARWLAPPTIGVSKTEGAYSPENSGETMLATAQSGRSFGP